MRAGGGSNKPFFPSAVITQTQNCVAVGLSGSVVFWSHSPLSRYDSPRATPDHGPTRDCNRRQLKWWPGIPPRRAPPARAAKKEDRTRHAAALARGAATAVCRNQIKEARRGASSRGIFGCLMHGCSSSSYGGQAKARTQKRQAERGVRWWDSGKEDQRRPPVQVACKNLRMRWSRSALISSGTVARPRGVISATSSSTVIFSSPLLRITSAGGVGEATSRQTDTPSAFRRGDARERRTGGSAPLQYSLSSSRQPHSMSFVLNSSFSLSRNGVAFESDRGRPVCVGGAPS